MANTDTINTETVININPQDPRAAIEIEKLRNVAAEQHRTINHLQQKLIEATTAAEKEAVYKELQQQLQRQTRFVQEAETCVQLLEDELSKAHEELSLQGIVPSEQAKINEEKHHFKDTLHRFSVEKKDLNSKLNVLEKENEELKQNNQVDSKTNLADQPSDLQLVELNKLRIAYPDLQKPYANLEEKCLNLKLKN